MPDSTRLAMAAQAIWGDSDLLVTLYSDGQQHLLLVQPPHSGNVPPPSIGGLTYMGEYHPNKLSSDGARAGEGAGSSNPEGTKAGSIPAPGHPLSPDGALLCENCGKPMAEHDDMARCWVQVPSAHLDGSDAPDYGDDGQD